jgi:hypothetical protein
MNAQSSKPAVICGVAALSFLVLTCLTANSYWAAPQLSFSLFLLMNGALAATILLSLPSALVLRQFLGMAYLLLVAFLHLWLGIVGLSRSGQFFVLFWGYSAVTPLATAAQVLRACVFQYPCTREGLRPSFEGEDVTLISATIVVISLAAIIAAVALVQRRRFGQTFWQFLISATAVAAIWMLLANALIILNGHSLYDEPWRSSVLCALFWPASCAFAFWAAKAKVNP